MPYVNAPPHIGHALEFVQTDVIARYYKIKGYDVFLTTGSDENSLKNVQAAEKLGVNTQNLCDINAHYFKEFAEKIGLSFNAFLRTSSKEEHWPGIEKLWKLCEESGDIYKKKYRGLYCIGCEAFYTE
ncbi:MAG: class I tRNA ligase family protein, partial [Nitrososphaerota archaeon]